jgi:hypothetical protein
VRNIVAKSQRAKRASIGTPWEEASDVGVNAVTSSSLQGLRSFFFATVALVVLGGCGSAPPEPAPPTDVSVERAVPDDGLSPGDRELHVADAFAELGRAERALDESLAPAPVSSAPRPPKTPPTSPSSPAADAASPPKEGALHPGCETACLALLSMRRSAKFVCRLTGPADGRCANANERLAAAERRVAAASCGCPTGDG